MDLLPILGPAPQPPREPAPPAFPAVLKKSAGTIDALYLHIPFCNTKCDYCDFYSLAGKIDRADAYLDALAREMDLHRDFFGKSRPRTIFIGGGTPTLLATAQLERLLGLLRHFADFSLLGEFTVEANPNTFDADKARVLTAGGVNRLSFGAQSFVPAELTTLQRDHDPESVPAAFATARAAGIENLNLDLIFGIPGQTLASWAHSLNRALELQPTHMSCYSLTYETGTGMTARLRRGEVHKIDEDLELQMFDHVYRRLSDAGFFRYETSNYARGTAASARVCLHNILYWKAANWLGLGTSAGSHIARPDLADGSAVTWQWKNIGSLAHYLGAFSEKHPHVPIAQMEVLSRSKWSAAAAVFWLRLTEGLNFAAFEARTGVNVAPALRRVLEPFAEMGLAEISSTRARLTEKGVAVSNHILARVLHALEKI